MPEDSAQKGFQRRPCSNCGNAVDDAWRPFCSKRCADIDLGRWLNGRYFFPGEPADVTAEAEPDQTG